MEPAEDRWNRGIIFFIILTMAKDGPIYGNQVSNLISERTEGAWKPSAGSIYPALERLKHRGLIERYEEGGKVMYRITEKGSAFVSKIRERHFERSPISKFMGKLWMDVMSPEERTRFILSSAQHTADSLEENLKNIRTGLENSRQYEVFLMTYELELEKTLKILRDARKELKGNQEV
ncbi:MAG: helix-turn-helix transcriptional regulator [Thermoplasmatales archaeon]|nr:helix-turn-helix transcriptional regulator [Candidatus Thermoplasmatota archaeon]MDA8054094.1 helix-turn-helix transcriptional regulator [Thermoplasmatales archaeon]